MASGWVSGNKALNLSGGGTIAAVINSIRGNNAFPVSIQKNGTASYSDCPAGYLTNEWNLLLFGDSARLTAILSIYPADVSVFKRDFFNGDWIGSWMRLH